MEIKNIYRIHISHVLLNVKYWTSFKSLYVQNLLNSTV